MTPFFCEQHTLDASELCNRCFEAARSHGVTFGKYMALVSARPVPGQRACLLEGCSVRILDCVHHWCSVGMHDSWCAECGTMRTRKGEELPSRRYVYCPRHAALGAFSRL